MSLRQGRIQHQADYRVSVGGRDLSREIAPRLISLALSETRGEEADTLDLVLDDSDNGLAIPKRGAEVCLALGWRGKPLVDKGCYTVDEVEHSGAPDVITIRARSASMTKSLHERREQSWHKETLESIVQTIAGRHSLKAGIANVLRGVAIGHIDQTHESDMSFLSRLAKRYDAVMNVKDLNLLFMPIGSGQTVSGKALTEMTLTRASGDGHRYHIAQRDSYDAVRAHYHSRAQGVRKSVVAGDDGKRNAKVLPETYASESEARAAVDAEFARTQRGQATMGYTLALARPDLFPELPVSVSGFKPEIDETSWLIKRAQHSLGESGFTTTLELEVRDDPASKRHRSRFRREPR